MRLKANAPIVKRPRKNGRTNGNGNGNGKAHESVLIDTATGKEAATQAQSYEEVLAEVEKNPPPWIKLMPPKDAKWFNHLCRFEALLLLDPKAGTPSLMPLVATDPSFNPSLQLASKWRRMRDLATAVAADAMASTDKPKAGNAGRQAPDHKSQTTAMAAELDACIQEKSLVAGDDARTKLAAPVGQLGTVLHAVYARVSGSTDEMTQKHREWLSKALEETLAAIAEAYRRKAPRRKSEGVELPVPQSLEPGMRYAERTLAAKYNDALAKLQTKAKSYFLAAELDEHATKFAEVVASEVASLKKSARKKLNAELSDALSAELDLAMELLKVPKFATAGPPNCGDDLRLMLGSPREFIGKRLKSSFSRHLRLPASKWARKNVKLVEGSGGAPTPYRYWKWQSDLLDVATSENENPKELYLQKASRVGFSGGILIPAILYNNYVKRLPQALYHPTEKMSEKFGRTALMPALQLSPLRDLMEERYTSQGKIDGRTKRQDNNSITMIDGVPIHKLASRSVINIQQISCDCIFVDECDSAYLEGSGTSFSEEVLRAARGTGNERALFGSAPSDRGKSWIVEQAENAGHRWKFFVPCPKCGRKQTIDWVRAADRQHGFFWEGYEGEEDANDDAVKEDRANTVFYRGTCGCDFRWNEFKRVLNEGHWQDHNGNVLDCTSSRLPVVWSPKGERVRWRTSSSFYIWAAYNPKESWSRLVYRFLRAQGDREKLSSFVRTYIGKEFLDTANEITPDEVADRQCFSAAPNWVETVVCGMDVQKDRIVACVFGFGDKRERHCFMQHKTFQGESVEDAADLSWALCAEWLNGTKDVEPPNWIRQDGKKLTLDGVYMDEGFATEKVRDFLKNILVRPRRRYPVKGSDSTHAGTSKGLVEPAARGRWTLILDTFRLKRICLHKMLQPRTEEMFVWLSYPDCGIDRKSFEELSAERLQYAGKNNKLTWVKRSHFAANECFDCYVYCVAGLRRINPDWLRRAPKQAIESAKTIKAQLDEIGDGKSIFDDAMRKRRNAPTLPPNSTRPNAKKKPKQIRRKDRAVNHAERLRKLALTFAARRATVVTQPIEERVIDRVENEAHPVADLTGWVEVPPPVPQEAPEEVLDGETLGTEITV